MTERRRYFEIARGSALECAAIQDCQEACHVLSPELNGEGKTMLLRIVSMLTKLARRDHEPRDEAGPYEVRNYDNDNDNDNEEDRGLQPDASPGPGTAGAEPGQ